MVTTSDFIPDNVGLIPEGRAKIRLKTIPEYVTRSMLNLVKIDLADLV